MSSGRESNRRDLAESKALLAELATYEPNDPRRIALRDRLIALHLPLVTYLARRFANRNEPLDDLIQVGSIGLIKAIDRFEPERNLEFSTFATPTILGEIRRHFRDTGWLVHVPRRAQELQGSLNNARAELSQQLGRSPTVAELAERLSLEQDVVLEALDAARAYSGVPLDVLVPSGESVPDHPALGIAELGFDQVEDRSALRGAIARLPQQEREVLALRFLGNKSQSEIATLIGVSQMQVSRIVARSLKKLRETLEES
jgi:RNA polymerase sigma-B factor